MESQEEHMETTARFRKRKNVTVLDAFSELSYDNQEKRIKAGITLLKHLWEKQSENKDGEICAELEYALQRLVRGLGTSRFTTRNGFFSALVGILSTIPDITIGNVITILNKELKPTCNISKTEVAEILTGRVLVHGALIRSGLLQQGGTVEEHHDMLTDLVKSSEKRSYLPLAANSFIVDYLDKVEEPHFRAMVWPTLRVHIADKWADQTLESLRLLLVLSRRFPRTVKEKTIAAHLGTPQVIHPDSIGPLAHLVLDVPTELHLQHPVYPELARELATSPVLEEFWLSGVSQELMHPTQKKELAVLHLLRLVLEKLTERKSKKKIPKLMVPRLVTLLLGCLSSRPVKGDKLQQSYRATLDTLVKALQGAPNKTIQHTLHLLLLYPGNVMFDKLTGCRVVQQVSLQLTAKGVKELAETFEGIMLGRSRQGRREGESRPWVPRERVYAAEFHSRLVGHPALVNDLDWRVEKLMFFVNLGMFDQDPGQDCEPVSPNFADRLRGCFYRALDHKLAKLDHVRRVLMSVVQLVDRRMSGGDVPRVPWNVQTREAWGKMVAVSLALDKARSPADPTGVAPIFHTLFLHMGLQMFVDPAMAVETLEDLHGCLERTETRRRSGRKGSSQEEPQWVEVAVDLLLSLLSRETHLLRSVATCVFPHLCPHLTGPALQGVLDVLDPQCEDNPLVSAMRRKDDSEDSGEEGVEDKDSSDEEMEEDEDSSDEEMEEDTVNDKLRSAVREALDNGASVSDAESVDMDQMDEAEGRRLNDALSKAFGLLRASRGKAKQRSPADEALMHFRLRTLDLLDCLFSCEPPLATCLALVRPLHDLLEFCIRDSHQKPLEDRVRGCLSKLAGVRRFSSVTGVDEASLAEVLAGQLQQGGRTAPIFLNMGACLAETSTFLVRCLPHLDQPPGGPESPLRAAFTVALDNFFSKKDCLLQPGLFKGVLQLPWVESLSLAPLLVQYAFNPEVRPFRRNQALDLLTTLYRNHRLVHKEQRDPRLSSMEEALLGNSLQLLEGLTGKAPPKMKMDVKQKFVCELMKLLLQVRDVRGGSGPQWEALGAAVGRYKTQPGMGTDLRSSLNKLCRGLGLEIPTSSKSNRACNGAKQGEEEPHHEEMPESSAEQDKTEGSCVESEHVGEEHKSKKRKKGNRKLKKEARELRLAVLSEGLDGVKFTNLKGTWDDAGREDAKSQSKRKHGGTRRGSPNKKGKSS